MGEVIAVVSGKGGVGKTTVVAHLGAKLAEQGKKVLLIDADMGLRNLDIALGAENRIVYDIADVLENVCSEDEAIIEIEDYPGLFFVPSPQTRTADCITEEDLSGFCRDMAEKYDFVIVDGPAGIGDGFLKTISGADRAIVVAQGYMASLRDADKTISFLEKKNLSEIAVVINAVRPDFVKQGIMLDMDYILDVLGTKLLGIIPEDIELLKMSGECNIANDSPAAQAFFNTAKRIMGEEVPIMDFTPKKKKRRFLFRKNKDNTKEKR